LCARFCNLRYAVARAAQLAAHFVQRWAALRVAAAPHTNAALQADLTQLERECGIAQYLQASATAAAAAENEADDVGAPAASFEHLFGAPARRCAEYAEEVCSLLGARLVFVEWRPLLADALYLPTPRAAPFCDGPLYARVDATMSALYKLLRDAHFAPAVEHVFRQLLTALEWTLLLRDGRAAAGRGDKDTAARLLRFSAADAECLQKDLDALRELFSIELSKQTVARLSQPYQTLLTQIAIQAE
jgi:hypothetical protein